MLFFLFSAFFMVSAGEAVTVTGLVEENVLLPCNCSDRNVENDFKWQLEGDNPKVLFKYNRISNVSDNQFETFIDKDSSNCSIILKNVTSNDEGKYRCSFYSGAKYNRVFVTLNICRRNISQYSQNTSSGEKVYHCDVKLDCNRETDIQWTLDGKCLTSSSTNNIVITVNNNGHHHFHSTLMTNSAFSAEPKCEVSPACSPDSPGLYYQPQEPDAFLRTLCKVVPVVLALGFLLIWCRCRGTSHRSPSEQDV